MENRVLGRAVRTAITGRAAVAPEVQHQEPAPMQAPAIAQPEEGEKFEQRREKRGRFGFGKHFGAKRPVRSQSEQKRRRKLEADGRKAARKGR